MDHCLLSSTVASPTSEEHSTDQLIIQGLL